MALIDVRQSKHANCRCRPPRLPRLRGWWPKRPKSERCLCQGPGVTHSIGSGDATVPNAEHGEKSCLSECFIQRFQGLIQGCVPLTWTVYQGIYTCDIDLHMYIHIDAKRHLHTHAKKYILHSIPFCPQDHCERFSVFRRPK